MLREYYLYDATSNTKHFFCHIAPMFSVFLFHSLMQHFLLKCSVYSYTDLQPEDRISNMCEVNACTWIQVSMCDSLVQLVDDPDWFKTGSLLWCCAIVHLHRNFGLREWGSGITFWLNWKLFLTFYYRPTPELSVW